MDVSLHHTAQQQLQGVPRKHPTPPDCTVPVAVHCLALLGMLMNMLHHATHVGASSSFGLLWHLPGHKARDRCWFATTDAKLQHNRCCCCCAVVCSVLLLQSQPAQGALPGLTCDPACAPGLLCVSGQCSCPNNLTLCNGVCVVSQDYRNAAHAICC
jgi:hypothetical protein